MPENISVTTKGEVYTCQNTSGESEHFLGTISNLDDVKLNTSWHWSQHDACRNCAVLQICKGSCMYLSTEKRRPTCDGHFIYNMAVMAAALYFMTGQKLTMIRGKKLRFKEITEIRF
jgi:uncharacterized protein